MDTTRTSQIAAELRDLADAERASFGLYREAHDEDAIARATTDGLVLFAADLLDGLARVDQPTGNSLIPLDDAAGYRDPQADLNLHAIELYGDDLARPRRRRLRVAKKEYAAIIGCLVALIVTTIFSLAGAYFLGSWAWSALRG